jgi:hypothetical protein
MTLKPFAAFLLSQTLMTSRLDSKEGDNVYNETISQTTVSLQWSKESSSRVIYRYSALSKKGFVDALVSRVLTPGTALHAGYNIAFTNNGGLVKKTTEMIFTKASYLFRL